MRNVHGKTGGVRGLRAASIGLAGAAVIVLASCGGGGNDDNNGGGSPPPASNEPPASASASSDGFIAYLKTLVVQFPESTEPLDLTNFTAPTADTAEPDPAV